MKIKSIKKNFISIIIIRSVVFELLATASMMMISHRFLVLIVLLNMGIKIIIKYLLKFILNLITKNNC